MLFSKHIALKLDKASTKKGKITDILNDLFYILYVLYKAEFQNKNISIGSLIKTLFNAKIKLSDSDIKFFNTQFYAYTRGPFNEVFYQYINDLDESDLLQKDGNNISLTTRGLDALQPIFEEFHNIGNNSIKQIDKILTESIVNSNDFIATSDKLHKEKVLLDDKKTTTMQEIIDKKMVGYLEPNKNNQDECKEILLPNTLLNKLLDIKSNVEEADFKEAQVFNNIQELTDELYKV